MFLSPEHLSQHIFGDNYFPLEIAGRVRALLDKLPQTLARTEVAVKAMTGVEAKALLDGLELGLPNYVEARVNGFDTNDLKDLNVTYDTDNGLTYLSFTPPTQLMVQVYRPTLDDAWAELSRIVKAFPQYVVERKPHKEIVEMVFWMTSGTGPTAIARNIDVQAFTKIEKNYTAKVRDGLEWTVNFRPDEDARLFLFHGIPGTGKTHVLRSLAWEWRKWAKFHYITDPETFFASPGYMFQVLSTQNGRMRPHSILDEDDDDDDAQAVTVDGINKMKWTVLVLEDCGELIMADAKDRTGQGLSRLLNMVDGLLGQGMKVLVIITTNEPIEKLNQAVTRAGRCAQQLEFAPLTHDEASAWLAEHQLTNSGGERTIADLFAQRRNEEPRVLAVPRKAMGFK